MNFERIKSESLRNKIRAWVSTLLLLSPLQGDVRTEEVDGLKEEEPVIKINEEQKKEIITKTERLINQLEGIIEDWEKTKLEYSFTDEGEPDHVRRKKEKAYIARIALEEIERGIDILNLITEEMPKEELPSPSFMTVDLFLSEEEIKEANEVGRKNTIKEGGRIKVGESEYSHALYNAILEKVGVFSANMIALRGKKLEEELNPKPTLEEIMRIVLEENKNSGRRYEKLQRLERDLEEIDEKVEEEREEREIDPDEIRKLLESLIK